MTRLQPGYCLQSEAEISAAELRAVTIEAVEALDPLLAEELQRVADWTARRPPVG